MKNQSSQNNTGQYLDIFSEVEKNRRGNFANQFKELRQTAIGKVKVTDFPTTRQEEWKYTDLGELQQLNFPVISPGKKKYSRAEQIKPHFFNTTDYYRLVFSDGIFRPELSSPLFGEGLVVEPFNQLDAYNLGGVVQYMGRQVSLEQNYFAALNTALFQDGVWIFIPPGMVVNRPIEIVHFSTRQEEPYLTCPRNLIFAGKNSQARIIENYCADNDAIYFTDAVTEMIISDGAVVEHFRVQNDSVKSFHIAATQVWQQKNSNYISHSFSFGAKLSRHNLYTNLAEEGVECTLNGLYVGEHDQHIDNHTAIDHASPNGRSHELYKGVLDDQAHGVFNGKIFVRPVAQKTNTLQSNNCILLSDDATIDTKPQLEIFADDVKCTHGATVGQLDEEAYFYMRSRGIAGQKARSLLIYAFASEVIDQISFEPVHEKVTSLFRAKLKSVRLE
jgi:Fe-S cluster assembly protein SufD